MPVRLNIRVPLQLAERRHRMHRQMNALDRVAHLTAQARTLRGRGLPDVLGALQYEDVLAAGFGQGVGDTTADGPAADDDEFRIRKHAIGYGWLSAIGYRSWPRRVS